MAKVENIADEILTKTKALKLPPSAIGHLLTTDVPTIDTRAKISDARKLIFEKSHEFDTINYIYVVSKGKRLKGVLSIKDIFIKKPNESVSKVMKDKLVKAHPNSDREKVAHLAVQNSIKAVPIVDDKGKFLGVASSDDIQDILVQESKEDLLRLTGIIGKHDDTSVMPIYLAFKNRAPWIIIGLLGSLFTASLIGSFQNVLQSNLILASFIPLIAYVSNATATQTQTLFVRDLAIQEKIDFKKYVWRQILTTLSIALLCWGMMLFVASIFWGSAYLGMIVGMALTIAILTATFLATLIPQILKSYGLDPAVGGGPFATVLQDFLSILIYFSIASSFL